MLKELMKFLDESRTAFNAVDNIKKELLENDYIELKENSAYKIKKGGKYFVTRNNSSILAFNIGKKLENPSLHICASHTDCPLFKLKPNSLIRVNDVTKLNIEPYGGLLIKTWFDRPLSIAGRLVLKTKTGVKEKIFDLKDPVCIIPSLAPHIGKIENLNPQVDLLPLISLEKDFDFNKLLSKYTNINEKDILSYDAYIYPVEKAINYGPDKEFISAQHIDNLESAYLSLKGFINNFNDNNINVYASFDNEEVGSLTYQGANSDFLVTNIERISQALNIDYRQIKANGMILSIDNAHACHPNHQELFDINNRTQINNGVVIKYNASQSYTSAALSGGILMELLKKNNIPYQVFANRSDIRGGSTLGNISNSQLSILSVDIGLAQHAMHSCFETAGRKDIDYMYKTCKVFYEGHLKESKNIYSL